MDVRDFQRRLQTLGHYAGAIDGAFGAQSQAALKVALTGPRDRLNSAEIAAVATDLELTPAHVGLADWSPAPCVALQQENNRALEVGSSMEFAA